jgi:hypothetical protein
MVGGAVVGLTNGRPQVVAATAIATGIFMVALDLSGDKTVFDEKSLDYKRNGLLPETHKESRIECTKESIPTAQESLTPSPILIRKKSNVLLKAMHTDFFGLC